MRDGGAAERVAAIRAATSPEGLGYDADGYRYVGGDHPVVHWSADIRWLLERLEEAEQNRRCPCCGPKPYCSDDCGSRE